MKQFDYLIVGQGIAGTALALTLMNRGRSVAVIDQPKLSSSSKVAAGAFNPFNFRKMMNNWRVEELTDFAFRFYPDAEKMLESGKILHPRRVLKILTSDSERNLWEEACRMREQRFAVAEILEDYFPKIIHAPFGIGVVREGGNIDTGMLLYSVSEKLRSENRLFGEVFMPGLLEITSGGIVYDGRIAAARIIFCEGHLGRHNPWFGNLPYRLVKGQVLHVHIPGLAMNDIIHRSAYVLPQGENLFVAGATFENDLEDEETTDAAEEELLDKLQKFIRVPVRVESRFAGVRPAVKDRRPMMGLHPQYPQLAVFNGLGSRGVLLAPWLAEQLTLFLEEGKPLPEEVRAYRFKGM